MSNQSGADDSIPITGSSSGSGLGAGGGSRSSKTTEYEEALLARLFLLMSCLTSESQLDFMLTGLTPFSALKELKNAVLMQLGFSHFLSDAISNVQNENIWSINFE